MLVLGMEAEECVYVICAIWGDWPGSRRILAEHDDGSYGKRGGDSSYQHFYINKLAEGVARHLSLPHRFICFSDDPDKVPEGIDYQPLGCSVFTRCIPKCWVYAFSPLPAGAKCLVIDLDTIIVGSLDIFFQHSKELVAREKFCCLSKSVPDGDIVYFRVGSEATRRIEEIYLRELDSGFRLTNGGDERTILEEAKANCWKDVIGHKICSYKYHAKRGLPRDSRIVSFHGKPLPHQATADWIKEKW